MVNITKPSQRYFFQTIYNLNNRRIKLTYSNHSTQIEESWEVTKSTRRNLKQMGLTYDPNETLKIPNVRKEIIRNVANWEIDDAEDKKQLEGDVDMTPPKIHVAEELETEAKAPRKRTFKLPNTQVYFLTYLMDRYGDDYQVMYFLVDFILH